MPCSAAISSRRSPNAPLAMHQQLLPGRHHRRDRHLHRRGSRAGDQQHLVRGRRAERRAQLVLQPAHHRRIVPVAVADVVVDQRRLHARRRHHRPRAEQHVAGLVLLGQQAFDQRQRPGRRRRRRGLHRRARHLVAVHAQQPVGVQLHLGAVDVLPQLGADVVRHHQPAARPPPPRLRSATARAATPARRPATATSRTSRR